VCVNISSPGLSPSAYLFQHQFHFLFYFIVTCAVCHLKCVICVLTD